MIFRDWCHKEISCKSPLGWLTSPLICDSRWSRIAGWWFQTFGIFSIIYGIILPIDELHHFSRWLKPPTRLPADWKNEGTGAFSLRFQDRLWSVGGRGRDDSRTTGILPYSQFWAVAMATTFKDGHVCLGFRWFPYFAYYATGWYGGYPDDFCINMISIPHNKPEGWTTWARSCLWPASCGHIRSSDSSWWDLGWSHRIPLWQKGPTLS